MLEYGKLSVESDTLEDCSFIHGWENRIAGLLLSIRSALAWLTFCVTFNPVVYALIVIATQSVVRCTTANPSKQSQSSNVGSPMPPDIHLVRGESMMLTECLARGSIG